MRRLRTAEAVAAASSLQRISRSGGKTSMIHYSDVGVFSGLPNPFQATRYHSLVIRRETMPACLEITAETKEGEVMGVRNRDYPLEGVQFHPESALTPCGMEILRNFLQA